jgi:hypothetical protein
MRRIVYEPIFDIGDAVFHVTRDSSEGIVLDIMHTDSTNEIEYLVAFGWRSDEPVICTERELSETKSL